MGEKVRVVMGTATPGGGFPAYGEPYCALVNELDTSLELEPRNTKGSTENVPLLEREQLDLGLATGEVFYEAISGIGRPPAQGLRIINAAYSQAGMFMVRGDSGGSCLSDLAGRKVVWGAASSGFVVLARYVMDGLGLDIQRDFDAILLDKAGDGPPLVVQSHADAMWGGGIGWPPFRAIAESASGGKLVGPTSEEIARITAKHPFLKRTVIPAGSYRGQGGPIHSVGSWPFVLARASLPDDVAYRIARALHEGHARFAQRLEQAQESTLENTLRATPDRELIHPGVLRYMRKVGLTHD